MLNLNLDFDFVSAPCGASGYVSLDGRPSISYICYGYCCSNICPLAETEPCRLGDSDVVELTTEEAMQKRFG